MHGPCQKSCRYGSDKLTQIRAYVTPLLLYYMYTVMCVGIAYGRDRMQISDTPSDCGCDIERLESRIKYLLDQTFNTVGKCKRLYMYV